MRASDELRAFIDCSIAGMAAPPWRLTLSPVEAVSKRFTALIQACCLSEIAAPWFDVDARRVELTTLNPTPSASQTIDRPTGLGNDSAVTATTMRHPTKPMPLS
jgi:hypothetical protein